jgi:hypothetical protein
LLPYLARLAQGDQSNRASPSVSSTAARACAAIARSTSRP